MTSEDHRLYEKWNRILLLRTEDQKRNKQCCHGETITPICPQCLETINADIRNLLSDLNSNMYYLEATQSGNPEKTLEVVNQLMGDLINRLPSALENLRLYWVATQYTHNENMRYEVNEQLLMLESSVIDKVKPMEECAALSKDEQILVGLQCYSDVLELMITEFNKNWSFKKKTNMSPGVKIDFDWASTRDRDGYFIPYIKGTQDVMFKRTDTEGDGTCQFAALWRQVIGERLRDYYPDYTKQVKQGHFSRFDLRTEILDFMLKNEDLVMQTTMHPITGIKQNSILVLFINNEAQMVTMQDYVDYMKTHPHALGDQQTIFAAGLLLQRPIVVIKSCGEVQVYKSEQYSNEIPIMIAGSFAGISGHFESLNLVNENVPALNATSWDFENPLIRI